MVHTGFECWLGSAFEDLAGVLMVETGDSEVEASCVLHQYEIAVRRVFVAEQDYG